MRAISLKVPGVTKGGEKSLCKTVWEVVVDFLKRKRQNCGDRMSAELLPFIG